MTDTLHMIYISGTGRIVRRFWGEDCPPSLPDTQDHTSYTKMRGVVRGELQSKITDAIDSTEWGKDRGPDTHRKTAQLCYDEDGDEIYAEGEVVPLDGEN